MMNNRQSRERMMQYLEEIRGTLMDVSAEARNEILESVQAQLEDALSPDATPEEVCAALARMDRPEDYRTGYSVTEGGERGERNSGWPVSSTVITLLSVIFLAWGGWLCFSGGGAAWLPFMGGAGVAAWAVLAFCRGGGGSSWRRLTILSLPLLALAVSGGALWRAGGAGYSAPHVASAVPAMGAKGVPAGECDLIVTFDREMSPAGYSWCTDGKGAFPKMISNNPVWENGKTCRIRVSLEPGAAYRIWLNHGRFRNFKSAAGAELPDTLWTFTTVGTPVTASGGAQKTGN